MWNHSTHLEAYFGIPAVGGVVHTLNLRLHPDELAFIANHAQDRWLIVDDVLLPIYERFADKVNFERVFVVPLSGSPTPAKTTITSRSWRRAVALPRTRVPTRTLRPLCAIPPEPRAT
jgi:acyl-CoA synthetase (AMP-forming)/AMP-acid ligase II